MAEPAQVDIHPGVGPVHTSKRFSLTEKIGPLPVWAWGVTGGGIFVVVWYLHRRAAAGQPNTLAATVPVGPPGAGGVPQSSGGVSSSDLQSLQQQFADQLTQQQQSQQQGIASTQSALEQALQAVGAQLSGQQSQEAQDVQGINATLASQQSGQQSALAALQQSIASMVDNFHGAAAAVAPVTSAANAIASWWTPALGIPQAWADQYSASHGGAGPSGIPALNAWLDQQGYRNSNGSLNTVPAAVRAAGSQSGAYVPGTQAASTTSPAGGGTWNGQSDAQIQQLFQATYGANWQNVWNQQHAAAVAKNGG